MCSAAEVKVKVGNFAKNFLPILFQLATRGSTGAENDPPALSEEVRMPVLECVRSYASVTDVKVGVVEFVAAAAAAATAAAAVVV